MVLPRFRVPEDIAIRVPQEHMRATLEDMFQHVGMSPEDASQSADVLVFADLRAIETHGVSNMMRSYMERFASDDINPRPNWKVVRESLSTATIDSDSGHGLVIGPLAMNMAIEKAEKTGIGAVAVGNGRHFGAAAYHAMMALPHDMIGVAMTVGGINVLPTWSSEPLIGLNPIGFAAPTRNEAPFVFDAAMSSVAGNKATLAKRLGVKMMPGWIADEHGTPIMEETDVPEKSFMLPVGGTRELGSHKGYGLSVMVDILCGVLSGTGPGFVVKGRAEQGKASGGAATHHFTAYKIEAFTDLEGFKDDMDHFMKTLKDSKPAPGNERVVYAGLPEHEDNIERLENGIPYHPEVIDWFRDITSELELEWRLT